jgi:hypothetical protein
MALNRPLHVTHMTIKAILSVLSAAIIASAPQAIAGQSIDGPEAEVHVGPVETETGANLELGYTASENHDLLVRGNHVVGGNRTMRMLRWRRATISGNVFYAATVGSFIQRLVTVEVPALPAEDYFWDGNAYFQGGASPPFIFQNRTMTFSGWQRSSGFDARSTYTSGRPGVRIFVRPNEYQVAGQT